MSPAVNVVWFRRDLRIHDNPALAAAAAAGLPVVPLYLDHFDDDNAWRPSPVSLNRERHFLSHLSRDLDETGTRLVVRAGEPRRVFEQLRREFTIRAAFWNRCYEPHERSVEEALRDHLRQAGIEVHAFDGNLLFAPGSVVTSAGTPYRVFTPFWRACRELAPELSPAPSPQSLLTPAVWPATDAVPTRKDTFDLAARIESFLEGYEDLRDRPDCEGTSRLSERLHFGAVGPRELWQGITRYAERASERRGAAADAFLRQLVWREFACHILFHYPHTVDKPMRADFAGFPWRNHEEDLERWRSGQTGYPIVDAGMRQLTQTGWIHNRVRLVVASFLVKHLLTDWRYGARHFWMTLNDADLANNTLGWQWVAGCGVDAAPYFRIFNPVLQGEKFDPDGNYVRAWVPEIAQLPPRWIHKPWSAPKHVLLESGVQLGREYPTPIVRHEVARERALDAYRSIRRKSSSPSPAATPRP
jgi:deoxyribodipyrimidine photo-lyase